MLKRVFAVRSQPAFTSFALLLLRIVAGVAFVFHGWPLIQNAFEWMGKDAWAPGWLQALAALSQFGGGIAWVLGFLTPLASFGLACTMAVAVYTHLEKGEPFVGEGGHWEPAAVYLCIAILLLATGPGRLSLDCRLFGVRGQPVSPA